MPARSSESNNDDHVHDSDHDSVLAYRCRIRSADDHHRWQTDKTSDLGHGESRKHFINTLLTLH